MLTALFVAARIIANPISNVFQKQLTQQSAGPIFIIAVTHALLTIACLPLLLGTLPRQPGAAFWANIATSAMLAVAGNVLLVFALQSTDLSVLGPVNAYKSLISLVLAIFLIGEVPSVWGVAGMLLILAGSYFVMDRDPAQPRRNAYVQFFRERGIQLRFAALSLSATEAVFLKKALLVSSPLTVFVFWSMLGLPVAALAGLLWGEPLRQEVPRLWRNRSGYLYMAATTGIMQVATLFTFEKLQVGYSLALFQLSTVISVFLGHHFFREGQIRRRLVASVIMAAGAALIVVQGSGRGGPR